MNLILVEPGELAGSRVTLHGRRAEHIHSVLKPAVGDNLKVGIIGEGRGLGTVRSLTVEQEGDPVVEMDLGPMSPSRPTAPTVTLSLALPRPKVLARVIAASASQGIAKIELINAWRVDKSYFGSPALKPHALELAARLGCEQGGHTDVPTVVVHSRFMTWLESLPERDERDEKRAVLHPGSQKTFSTDILSSSALRIAIGPEGGWIDRELASLAGARFTAISIGDAVLRVETATAAALGQIELLRSGRERP